MFDINNYDIEIKRHAFIRAMQRGVTPDMIEATLRGGCVKKFGKNSLKFYKAYKRFVVVCVDQIVGSTIKIVNVETRGSD